MIGQWLPDPKTWGLDYALIAMFVALLVLTLSFVPKTKLMHYLKLIACMALILYVLSYFIPGHLAVLVATILVATIGVVTEK